MAGVKIKYFGYAGFRILSEKGKIIIIDPWFTDNPMASCTANDITKADLVLVTHDHFDHVGDAAQIVKATGATLVGMPETVGRLMEDGVPESQIVYGMGMNIGGTVQLDGICITMTQAFHSSQTAAPAGYIIKLENGLTCYHAGDTGVFSSMEIFGKLYNIDLAMLPIGGVFTMDPSQAVMAAKLLGVGKVIPMHYGTFPVLEQTPASFVEMMKKSLPDVEVVILEPGEENGF